VEFIGQNDATMRICVRNSQNFTSKNVVWVLNHQKEKFFQQQSSLTQRGLNHVESPNKIWNQLPTEADCRP